MDALDRTEIRFSRWKCLLGVLGSLCFAAACVVVAFAGVQKHWFQPGNLTPVMTLVAAGGLVLVAFAWLCKLFDRQPAVVLDSTGITDRAGFLSTGFVPWSDVASLGRFGDGPASCVVVRLRHDAPYVTRGSLLRQWLNGANLILGGSSVNLSAMTLGVSFGELERLCDDYLTRYGAAP